MYKVVIADDEVLIRMYIREILENNGYEVVGEAEDGLDAIAVCRQKKPDFVIMDINMPVMTGLEATKVINEDIASSVTGDIVADAGEAAYARTKVALVGLTKCLAVEYANRNIRVNCSQLGYARTPMVEKMAVESNPENPEAAIADIAVGVPMKRLAKPIEVGGLFAFLGSDESSYLTGSQIVIDGGSTFPETMSIGTN